MLLLLKFILKIIQLEIYLECIFIYFPFTNLIRKLLEDERVKFAGYKMPHPLENMIKIKI